MPLPLFLMSSGQINAQIPPNLAAGTYPLVVHSIANQAASASQNITVSKVAPAVFVDGSGNALLYHADGTPGDEEHPGDARRAADDVCHRVGRDHGRSCDYGDALAIEPAGGCERRAGILRQPSYTQAAMIVDWAGLAPGLIGVYQLNLRIPGFHMNGDALPITVRVGTVNSPTTGVVVPTVSVN